MAVGMSQQKNGFLGMVDEFTRQAGLIVSDQRNAIFTGNVFCGNDHEFMPRDARTESDLPDSAAGNLAAHRGAEEHVRQNHVVDVLRLSSYFVAPFLARNRLADDGIS